MSVKEEVATKLRSAVAMLEEGKMTEDKFIGYVRGLMEYYYEELNVPEDLRAPGAGEIDVGDEVDFD